MVRASPHALTETAGDAVRHFPARPQLVRAPGDGSLRFVWVARLSCLLLDDGSLVVRQHNISLEIVRSVCSN